LKPYPMKLTMERRQAIRVSPTVANPDGGHWGIAVVCADCRNATFFHGPGLRSWFSRHYHLTLLELERVCVCQCGSRNARCYPWPGTEAGDALGLEGPPPESVVGGPCRECPFVGEGTEAQRSAASKD
jgi:hypothetical protein